MKKVFISYSHKDEEWKDRLMPHLRTLEQQGEIELWDDRKIGAGADWYPAIKRGLEQAAVAICLISADYLASDFINKEEIPDLKLRRSCDGMLLLPILVRPCPWKTVQWLKGIQMFPRDGKSIAEIRGETNQEKALSQIAEYVYEKIKEPAFQLARPAIKWALPEKVDIDRLPKTGAELFGRQKELELLDKAWQFDETRVVSLVASGGVGKSTLVNKWLELMGFENYRGAIRVFGWSFYSQGTKERVTSADKFISEALAWFGDSDPKKGSPWDKGQRLAELIRKKKTLLVLDGLEPLQSDFEGGKIKDAALSMFVTQLARNNNGLCVITTRLNVAELARFDKGVEQLNLDQISKDAGRALLRVGGVQGTDAELEKASEEFGNHALAINLLASFIHDIPGHHISNASKIGDLDIPEKKGKHPRRVIEAFEKRFGEGPEVHLLRILGLFDRPIEMDAIKAVYNGESIADLTDKLVDLTEAQWQNLLEKLREYKLLAKKSKHRPDIVDCHPLVREHFGEKLQKDKPEAWKEAHGRLYGYYKGLPEKLYGKFLPDTLEEMEPLFSAVAHGCQAGKHQKTFADVYYRRIQRDGKTNYCCARLGAFGSDLAALSNFFEIRWSKVSEELTDLAKAAVLNFAGFRLMALGRLRGAAQPMQADLEMATKQKDLRGCAQEAGNLSELYLTLGEVKKTVDYAQQSVDFADQSGEWESKLFGLAPFAEALHQAGEFKESENVFHKLENHQKKNQPEYPYLYGLRGFRFCDLLLSQGKVREVLERAGKALEWAEEFARAPILDFAMNKLSLGRAYLLEAVSKGKSKKAKGTSKEWEPESVGLGKAADFLNQAVDGLRAAGTQHHIAKSLFARAELYRFQRSWKKAWADLEEAKEVAERGEMNLYMADYHLEAARLSLDQGERLKKAREHLEEARERIKKIGYHRRDPEVLLIQAEIEITEGNKKQAKGTLKTAERRINEMGCHRWDIELERLRSSPRSRLRG